MTRERVVLLVEDEEPNRALLRAILTRAADRLPGIELLEAADLAAAREALAARQVDLVLLDVRLPDGSGLSLIPAEGERRPGSPSFVVLSASVLAADRATALGSGAAGFLAKPYRSSELIDTVAEVLAIEG